MIYLLLSVLCTCSTFLIFRKVDLIGKNLFAVVVVNYLTCSLVGGLFLLNDDVGFLFDGNLVFFSAICGLLFISMFFLLGVCIQKLGIAISTLVSRISLVIPALFFLIYLRQTPGYVFIVAMILAVLAIFIVLQPSSDSIAKHRISNWGLPIIVFIGFGLVDIMLRFANSSVPDGASYHLVSFLIFSTATIFGLLAINKNFPLLINRKTLYAGLPLGLVNYFSIFFFMHGMQKTGISETAFFPINGILILVFTNLGAVLFFRDALSIKRIVGLGLAIVSSVLLFFNA